MRKKLTAICIATFVAITGAFAVSQMPKAVKVSAQTTDNIGLVDLSKVTPKGGPRHHQRETFKKSVSGTTALPFQFQSRVSANSPLKISPSGATVYGYLAYSAVLAEGAWQWDELYTDGSAPSTQFQMTEYITAGCIRDGQIQGYGQVQMWGMVSQLFYGKWDMTTGALIEYYPLNLSDLGNAVLSMAYDPVTDTAYVYSYTQNGDGYLFCSVDPDDPEVRTVIKEISNFEEIAVSFTRSTKDGKLYAINSTGLLMTVDPTTGDYTEVMDTGLELSDYITGLCYSIKDDAFIFNANLADSTSALYKIDPEAETCTKLYDFSYFEEYTFIATTDEIGDENAPAKPELKTVNFPEGNLSGTITYKVPSKTYNGNSISGQVSYFATVDDNVVAEGKAWGGELVKVSYSDLAQGTHLFTFTVTDKNGLEGPALISSFYIGIDNPKAPQNVVFDNDGISWDAVTDAAGEHGGYVNIADMTYEVYVNGVLVGTTTETSIPYAYDGEDLSSHVAKVIAISSDMKSKPGVSNMIVFGEPLDLPLNIEPEESEIAICSFIDNNGDGKTWESYFTGEDYFFVYSYSPSKNADDWLVLPPATFDKNDVAYSVSLDYCVPMSGYSESFEIYFGKQPIPGKMTKVTEVSDIQNTDWLTKSEIFVIPEPGTYYVAIRCTSERDKYDLRVRNLKVERTRTSIESPEAVTDLSAVAAEKGELKAFVTFTMPTTTLSGNTLSADAELTASVFSSVASATATGKPGSTHTVEVPSAQGDNTIMVQVNHGNNPGRKTTVDVYTGCDFPSVPENFKGTVSADNMTIHLSWDAPTEGLNGGYIRPNGEGMIYNIVGYNDEIGWFIDETVPAFAETSYDYTLPEGTPQNIYTIGVIATNEAGMSADFAFSTFVAGSPYELPMKEDFLAGYLLYNPLVAGEDDGSWNFTSPSWIDEKYTNTSGIALAGTLKEGLTSGTTAISLPKFSTLNAQKPAVIMDMYCGSAVVSLWAEAYDVEPVKILSSDEVNGTGWLRLSAELPEQFIGKTWVMVTVKAEMSSPDQIALFSYYEFKDRVANDLAIISVSAPSEITIGKECVITGTIENYGSEAQGIPYAQCDIYKDDKLIKSLNCMEVPNTLLNEGEKYSYEFSFTTDADYIGELTAVVSIVGSDMKPDNNSKSRSITVIKGNAIAVTDLSGKANDKGGVTLTWSALELPNGDESFEYCDLWSYDSTIAGFKNVDGDGMMTQYIYGLGVPGEDAPKAFQVYNIPALDPIFTGMYPASDGDVYLAAFCPSEPINNIAPADDWLISPELNPGTTFSFELGTFTANYGAEIVEILVSTTTDDIEAFSLVDTIYKETTEWETFTYTLPADGKYLAIHYVSTDIFGIMVDNFHYSPAMGVDSITGYDIYRNGELLAENTAVDCTYTDNAITDSNADYTYYVVPVIDGIRYEKSNTVTINPSAIGSVYAAKQVIGGKGVIVVNGCEGEAVSIFSADGKVIAKTDAAEAKEEFMLEPGIYIVRTGRTSTKVIVR